MSELCKYKNLFGEPNAGLRKYRIFDIAILDVAVTILIVWLISWIFKLPFLLTLVVVFILGIFVHRLFCVRTGLDKKFFPDVKK